jgi:hypothetical protein
MKICSFAVVFFAAAVVAALIVGLPCTEGEPSPTMAKSHEAVVEGGGTTCDGSREGWGLCWGPDEVDEDGNFISRPPSYPCWCEEAPATEESPPSSHAPPTPSRREGLSGFFRGFFRPKPF